MCGCGWVLSKANRIVDTSSISTATPHADAPRYAAPTRTSSWDSSAAAAAGDLAAAGLFFLLPPFALLPLPWPLPLAGVAALGCCFFVDAEAAGAAGVVEEADAPWALLWWGGL